MTKRRCSIRMPETGEVRPFPKDERDRVVWLADTLEVVLRLGQQVGAVFHLSGIGNPDRFELRHLLRAALTEWLQPGKSRKLRDPLPKSAPYSEDLRSKILADVQRLVFTETHFSLNSLVGTLERALDPGNPQGYGSGLPADYVERHVFVAVKVLRSYAEHELGFGRNKLASPAHMWQPPKGYVGCKTILHSERFRKKDKNPPRTTIDQWARQSKSDGLEVSTIRAPVPDNMQDILQRSLRNEALLIIQAPDSGENHYPECWILSCVERWHPRQPKT